MIFIEASGSITATTYDSCVISASLFLSLSVKVQNFDFPLLGILNFSGKAGENPALTRNGNSLNSSVKSEHLIHV